MKTHLQILAWFYIVTCGLLLTAGTVLVTAFALDRDPAHAATRDFVAWLFGCVCCVLIPAFVGGIGVLRRRGWGRVLLLIVSGVMTPMFPVGTLLAIYGFWSLLHAESRSYFGGSVVGQGWSFVVEPSPPRDLICVMAMVGAGIYLVLKVGFLLHDDPIPEVFRSVPVTVFAVLVLAAGMMFLARVVAGGAGASRTQAQWRRRAAQVSSQRQEGRRRRVAELAADPGRAKYAPLVERGEDWSDENIAYAENPEATATCEHLAPIERAMRAAGVVVKRYRDGSVVAECRVNEDRLHEEFRIEAPVKYAEFETMDRGVPTRPEAYLMCGEHPSMICTLHPLEGTNRVVPWFPAEPRDE